MENVQNKRVTLTDLESVIGESVLLNDGESRMVPFGNEIMVFKCDENNYVTYMAIDDKIIDEINLASLEVIKKYIDDYNASKKVTKNNDIATINHLPKEFKVLFKFSNSYICLVNLKFVHILFNQDSVITDIYTNGFSYSNPTIGDLYNIVLNDTKGISLKLR